MQEWQKSASNVPAGHALIGVGGRVERLAGLHREAFLAKVQQHVHSAWSIADNPTPYPQQARFDPTAGAQRRQLGPAGEGVHQVFPHAEAQRVLSPGVFPDQFVAPQLHGFQA